MLLALLALVLIVVLAVGWVLLNLGPRTLRTPRTPRARRGGTEFLIYRVPAGEEPEAVLVALAGAGYRPRLVEVGGARLVEVPCAGGRALRRGEVRSLIAASRGAVEEGVPRDLAVRFEDEDRR